MIRCAAPTAAREAGGPDKSGQHYADAVPPEDVERDRPPSRQRRPPEAELAYQGALFEVWRWEQRFPGGGSATFETLQRPDTALILPVTDNGQVLLAREQQPGMQPMLRSLGGRIRGGEAPDAAARRELLEESGYGVAELRLWDAWQPVNKIDWAVYLFVGHGLRREAAPQQDPGERVELELVSVQALLERNSTVALDDYELEHKLLLARADDSERRRVTALLSAA